VSVVLCWLVPVKTNLFFALGFALFFLLECFFSKPGFLSGVTLFLVAPVFQYAINVFSFPIRLQITKWAGQVFSLFIPDTRTAGNIIYYQGNEFSVDAACIGLSMLISSLLISIMLLGYWMKKEKKEVPLHWLILYFFVVLLFNVLGNLFRILILVQFSIAPATSMHDSIGIFCLLLYMVLPVFYIASFFVKKFGSTAKVVGSNNSSAKPYWLHFLLVAFISLCSYYVLSTDTYNQFNLPGTRIGKYKASKYSPGIIKLESQSSLVYVKYVRGFYDTDHNPTICWKGSGYEFQQIEYNNINGFSFYTAVLVKDKEKLYTAWWYGNGKNNTNNQFTWRWDMVKGSNPYAVVNVTALEKQILFKEVNEIIKHQSLKILFNN
jgi:exosortase N